MSSPRERQLAEGIKNKLIAIQKSRQIYEKLSRWERKALLMDQSEKVNVANSIAAKTEKYAESIQEKTSDQPTPGQVIEKIRDELERI